MPSADEFFQQGFAALQRNDDAAATSAFNEAVRLDSGHFGANYLLACEAAHLGDTERARALFQKAMVREPLHAVCRFQAGLLELTAGNLQQCAAIWSHLESTLPDEHYIKLFVQGCLAMALNEFADARVLLEKGLRLNTENPALNRDMTMMLKEVMENEGTPPSTPAAGVPDAPDAAPAGPDGSTLAALQLFQHNKTRH